MRARWLAVLKVRLAESVIKYRPAKGASMADWETEARQKIEEHNRRIKALEQRLEEIFRRLQQVESSSKQTIKNYP